MRVRKSLLAAIALVSASFAHAADDPGLTLHNTGGEFRRLGVGAQLRIAVPLGRIGSREATNPKLELRAGPAMTRLGHQVALRSRTTIAPLAAFAVRPGHTTSLTLAGQPLMIRNSKLALREQPGDVPDGERSNISTVGIVAIGVGVAAIIGGLLFIDAVNDASD